MTNIGKDILELIICDHHEIFLVRKTNIVTKAEAVMTKVFNRKSARMIFS